MVRNIAGGMFGGRKSPGKAPIATPRTRCVCPGISRGPAKREGGRIRSPGAGRKRKRIPFPGRITRDRPPESPLLGAGAGEREEGRGSAVWGNYGGQTVQIRLVSFLEGSGGRGIRLGGGVLGAMGGSVGDEGIVRRSGLEWGQGRCPGEDQAFSSAEVVGPEGTGPFFRRALGELEPDGWGERMGAVEGRVSSRAASPCGPFRTIAGEGCGGGGERWRGRRRS